MDSNIDINLYLENGDSASQLSRHVYESELQEINNKFPLGEDEIDINETYFLKKESTLEVGFFIRNGLIKKLSFEEMMLVVQDENENTILIESFNFKELGAIPPRSGRPFVVNFKLSNPSTFKHDKKYTLKFKIDNPIAFHSVESQIEDLPIDISFEEEKEIKDFLMGLETVKKDEISLKIFKLSYNKDEGLDCTLVIRNGSSKAVRLDRLPITIYSQDGEIIAKSFFASEEGLATVSPQKSKIIQIEIKPSDVSSNKCDLSKCKTVFR